jgi:hypothetical protein
LEDTFELLRTLWTTNADAEGWDPVQLALIMLLAGIMGYRPDALLSLRHQDVKITLLSDPAFDNRPWPVVELKPEKTKRYRCWKKQT